jgi:hypothetical protein
MTADNIRDICPFTLVWYLSTTQAGSIGIISVAYSVEFEGPHIDSKPNAPTRIASPFIHQLKHPIDELHPLNTRNPELPISGDDPGAKYFRTRIVNQIGDGVPVQPAAVQTHNLRTYINRAKTVPVNVVNTTEKPALVKVTNAADEPVNSKITNKIEVEVTNELGVQVNNTEFNPVPTMPLLPLARNSPDIESDDDIEHIDEGTLRKIMRQFNIK